MRKLLTLTAAAAFALAVGFGGTAQGKEGFPFDTNLVGYWHFDTNAGTVDAVDGSGNGNTGDLRNGATRSTDVPDLPSNLNSVELDGTNDVKIDDAATLDVTGALTLAAWVKVDGTALFQEVIGKWDNAADDRSYELTLRKVSGTLRPQFAISTDGTGGGNIVAGGINASTGFTPGDGNWHHVAATFQTDASGAVMDELKVFLDGVLVDDQNAGTNDTIHSGGASVFIGAENPPTSPLFLQGKVDDVRIYDVALTGAQIATIFASLCDFTIDRTASIQDTIDAASLVAGKNVCLIDDAGVFADREVIFESEHSGITLRAANGNETPVLDGSGLSATGSHFAISFDSDDDALVEDVEIRGLTIQNYAGSGGGISGSDRSSAIQAFGTTPTEGIRIRENTMTDFAWNGVLVGSEGDVIHKAWMVHSNTVKNVVFIGIELTNCRSCSILHNDVVPGGSTAGRAGILIQARNTIPSSGEVHINGVNVLHNTVDSVDFHGIEVLVFEGLNALPFTSIGVSALLTSVTVSNNTLLDNGAIGIRFRAFNAGATLRGANIKHNAIDCDGVGIGILVAEAGISGDGTVRRVRIKNNTFDNCPTDIED